MTKTAASPAGAADTASVGRAVRGRAVLVTGAARGIGTVLARTLAEAGADVAITARPESHTALETLAAELRGSGGRVVVIPAELSEPEARIRLVTECRAELGRIDVLVNNAAIEIPGPFAVHPGECIHELLDTNLVAPMHLARLVLPAMLERGTGQIVNIGAMAGRWPTLHHATYAASKAGLAAWSATLREELRGSGVGVSIVCPGFVGGTGMHARLGIRAPWCAREVPPQAVCAAVLRAIGHDTGETLLWPVPVRPLLALLQLVPAAARPWLRASGLRAFLELRAGRAAEHRRDGL